jgi:hypothetical protein
MRNTEQSIKIGVAFIRWGLGLLVFGIFIGFGPIAHYVVGAQYPTGDIFMHNVTLWFACPWTLSVYVVQGGALGMVVIGTMYLALGRTFQLATQSRDLNLWLCVIGLVTVFLTGYIGYFVVDQIWPTFYYSPVATGKNVWLVAQAISIAIYWLGLISVLFDVRKIANQAAYRDEDAR